MNDRGTMALEKNTLSPEDDQALRAALRQPVDPLCTLSVHDMVEGLRARRFSSVELTQAALARIRKLWALGAFVPGAAHDPERQQRPEHQQREDKALLAAKASDARLAKGEPRLLEGIPFAIKDLFCTEGERTTACSAMLENFLPTYESHVSGLVKSHGGVALGKTNMDEFAMGSSTMTSLFGWCRNPCLGEDKEWRSPGGSSGGSAASVAAQCAPAALGSDTGGSIRQPAAFCGIVGVKPTYGRCSRRGMIAFASSLDQAGVLTRHVKDAALFLRAMSGHDEQDMSSATIEVPDFTSELEKGIKGLRVGIPHEYEVDDMPEDIKILWEQGRKLCEQLGAKTISVSLPHTRYALPCYYIIAPAEASANLSRYDGVRYGLRVDADSVDAMFAQTRAAGFGNEVKRRLLIGCYVLSSGYYDAYYDKAQRVRARISDDFAEAFKTVDVLLTPAAPSAAFPLSAPPSDPISMYLQDVFTVPASLAGLPGIAIPFAEDKQGLPLGLQIIGRPYDEVTMFRAAHQLEKHRPPTRA